MNILNTFENQDQFLTFIEKLGILGHLLHPSIISIFFFHKEVPMTKKVGKSISFDLSVKYFMEKYDIATKKDIKKLITKIDRLEKTIKKSTQLYNKSRHFTSGQGGNRMIGKLGMSASDVALEVVKGSKKGANFADIQAKTGFNDKKLRNIIFRLNKIGKIKRKKRGIYVAN